MQKIMARVLRPAGGALPIMLALTLHPIAAGAAPAAKTDTPADVCFTRPLAPIEDVEDACTTLIYQLEATTELPSADRLALASAYNNRAIARRRLGDLEGSGADIAAGLILNPGSPALLLNQGNLALASDDPAAALAAYRRVEELAPEMAPLAARNAVLAYRALQDLAGASQSLARAAGVTTDPPEARDARPGTAIE